MSTLEFLAEEMIELKDKRAQQHLDLLDYIGSQEDPDGDRLAEKSIPAPGVAETILDEGIQSREKLQLEQVSFKDRSELTLYATCRYKPEDKEEHDGCQGKKER